MAFLLRSAKMSLYYYLYVNNFYLSKRELRQSMRLFAARARLFHGNTVPERFAVDPCGDPAAFLQPA